MSPTPESLTAALLAEPQRAALVLDFDGVLAPIVEDPQDSRMPDPVRDALAGVAQRLGVVAVLSGRPVAFLAERADVPGVRLLGSYGAETWQDGRAEVDPAVEPWLPAVLDATATLRRALDGPQGEGLLVEAKPASVAVHWRRAADRDAAEAAVRLAVARAAADTGLRPEPGKLVLELVPPVPLDKGHALRRLLAREPGVATCVYVGDDLGDLPAFEAVAEAGGHGVLVAHGAETPERLRSAAAVTVEGPDAVRDLLERLATA